MRCFASRASSRKEREPFPCVVVAITLSPSLFSTKFARKSLVDYKVLSENEVKEINFEDYLAGTKANSEDKYFKCSNKQEQEYYKCVKLEEIYPEEKEKPNYKKKRNGQRIKNRFLEKEMIREIRGVIN